MTFTELIQSVSLLATDAPIQGSPVDDTSPLLKLIVAIGTVTIAIGIILCLYRLLKGPHLADRVLAGDVLALQVVAIVILLAIYMRTTIFFDAALVVAIIGFASTLAFAQYIGSQKATKDHPAVVEASDDEE